MTYPGQHESRPVVRPSGLQSVPNYAAADGTANATFGPAPMSPAARLELADARRRAGRDSSRPTWLALQVGDIFRWLGARLGVLYVGPIVVREGVFDREIAVMYLDSGGVNVGWANDPARGRLLAEVDVATPERAAQARAAWAARVAAERAELDELRAVAS